MDLDTLLTSPPDSLAIVIAGLPQSMGLAFELYLQKITGLTPEQLVPVYYVLSIVALVWAAMSIYSVHRWRKWRGRIKLGRFTSSGDLAQEAGDEELRLMLRAQLEKITSTYARKRSGVASFYTASAVGDRFRGLNTALISAWVEIKPQEIADLDEFTIKLWNVEIPIVRLVRTSSALLRAWIPVPKRVAHLNSIIHGSITVVNEQAVLVIYKGAPPPGAG